VDFFAGETIKVGAGQGAAAADGVAEGVISVFCNKRLAAVQHKCDIPISVCVVEIVGAEVAAGITVRTGEQTADAASSLQTAA